VPATERPLNFPWLPAHLFLDTCILIAYLVRTDKFHDQAREFLQRLTDEGATVVYITSQTWMEFAYVVGRPSFRRRLPDEVRDRFDLGRWDDDAGVRRAYHDHYLLPLEDLLGQFAGWAEIPVTADAWARSRHFLIEYDVSGQDAVHLAAIESLTDIRDVASFDKKLRRLDGWYVWIDPVNGGIQAT
jgi:predicted nucleic acid-binding protein